MSTERAKCYLRHLEQYAELNDNDKGEYLDGVGGDLLDNLWYSMTAEEQEHCSKTCCAIQCKKNGHDETAEDKLMYDCVCGSRKPYKMDK